MATVDAAQRVQRVPEAWPVVHLEAEAASVEDLRIDGLVVHPRVLSLDALGVFDAVEEAVPVHCVWGWSRPTATWAGVRLGDVLDLVEPRGLWVTLSSASGTYSSCLPLVEAAAGLLVWARDGEPLSAEAGGPLRYVAPPAFWAYKHVKWVNRITVLDEFRPGFWEAKVADPLGRIPDAVVLP